MILRHRFSFAALIAVTLMGSLTHAGILEDRAIEDAIEGSFVFRSVLTDRSMIQIYVRHGEVELRGQAADERERALLEYTIANIPTVVRVDSHLFVDSSGRRDSFRWRAARIIAHLHTQADLDVGRVQIEAHEGTLDLIGTTTTAQQRDRIEARVRQLAPNERLTNRLQIDATSAKSAAVDDASIVAMVRCALDALSLGKDPGRQVSCRAGEVVIDGAAATSAETENITRCVESIRGVRLVHNRLAQRS